MKMFIMIFGLIFSTVANAQNGIYYLSEPAHSTVMGVEQALYQFQVRSYQRKDVTEPWALIGDVTLCFSVQVKPNCYHAAKNFLGMVGLPKEPNGPVIYTNFVYGLNFSEPIKGKVWVASEQTIQRKVDEKGSWQDVFPSLAKSEMLIDIGEWAAIEFNDSATSMHKIEARITPSP